MESYWLYILLCADGAYYVGTTGNLDARMAAHDSGSVDFTRARRPLQLAYAVEFPTRDEAFIRERQVKGWSRAKKAALITEDWDRLHALAKTGVRPSTSALRAFAQDEV